MTEASQNTPTVFSLNDVALRANKLILETEETPKEHRFLFGKADGFCFLPYDLVLSVPVSSCLRMNYIGDEEALPWWANKDGIKAIGLPDYFDCYFFHAGTMVEINEVRFVMQAASPDEAMKKLDAIEDSVADASGTDRLGRVRFCVRDLYGLMAVSSLLPRTHPEIEKERRRWLEENKPSVITKEYSDALGAMYERLLKYPLRQEWQAYRKELDNLSLEQGLRALRAPEKRYAETAVVMRGDIARRYPLLKGELGFREVCQP